MKLRVIVLSFTVLLLAIAFLLDYVAGREFDLWLLYILPLAVASLGLGRRYGYLVAVAASALLIVSGYLVGNPHESETALAFDRVSQIVAFLLFAFLIGVIRDSVTGSGAPPDSQPPASQK